MLGFLVSGSPIMVFLAFRRALGSLFYPGVLVHLLWPTALAILLWVVVWIYTGGPLAEGFVHLLESLPWLGRSLQSSTWAQWIVGFSAKILLLVLFVPLVSFTATLLLSNLALPLMLDHVSERDYRDLERRRGGNLRTSLYHAAVALIGFVVFATLALPLWFIPVVSLVVSVLLSAWTNLRCYGYDVLVNHADAEEIKRIPRHQRGGLWKVGILAGLLAYVPLLNLLVPALTGLAYVHFLLEALRRDRAAVVRQAA